MSSVQQREAALKKANEIRTKMSQFKRDMKALPPREALGEMADRVESWDPLIFMFRIRDLSTVIRYMGRQKSQLYARHLGCSEDDRVSDLSDEQLQRLVGALRDPRLVIPKSRL